MEYVIHRDETLQHWGIKGQKWGVRRYENEDGTLTEEGKMRYARTKRYVQKKYKSPGRRIGGTIGKSLLGAGIGATALLGLGVGVLTGGGKYNLGAVLSAAGTDAVLPLLGATVVGGAVGGLGTAAVSGIKNSVQAHRVRRGFKFMNAHQQAYEASRRQDAEMEKLLRD